MAIIPAGGKFSAGTHWRDAVEHQATFYTAVPTMHQVCSTPLPPSPSPPPPIPAPTTPAPEDFTAGPLSQAAIAKSSPSQPNSFAVALLTSYSSCKYVFACQVFMPEGVLFMGGLPCCVHGLCMTAWRGLQVLLARASKDFPADHPPPLRFIRSCSSSLAAATLHKLEEAFKVPVLEVGFTSPLPSPKYSSPPRPLTFTSLLAPCTSKLQSQLQNK